MKGCFKGLVLALMGLGSLVVIQGCQPDGLQACESQSDCFLEERCVDQLCIEPEEGEVDAGDTGTGVRDASEDANDDASDVDADVDGGSCEPDEQVCEEGCCWFETRSLGGVGASSFVVMDDADRPHLVYEDESQGAVMVVGPELGAAPQAWFSVGMMSGYSRPIWDGEAGLVAAVRDGHGRSLRLMRRDGASGEVAEETLELSSAMRSSLAVAQAGDGELHLVAEVENDGGLSTLSHLRERSVDVWEGEEISIEGPGNVSSLDVHITPEGDAHLAMIRWPQRVLEYGTDEVDGWHVRSMAGDLVDEVGEFASMVLTPVGLPVIVYGDTTNGAVRVVRSNGSGGWIYREVAEGLHGNEFHPQVAVDGAGRLHVLFWEGDADEGYGLRYAREQGPATNVWDVFLVADDVGFIAQPRAGLAVDDAGQAHVLYADRGSYRQVYGRWRSRAVEE